MRTRGPELSSEQRSAIYHLSKAGVSQTELANDFSCSRKTIFNTIKRFQTHQTFNSLSRTGRPTLLSPRSSNYLLLQARRHPFWTYKQLCASLVENPSRSTIKRVLSQFGLAKRLSKKKIPISTLLARKRLRFARKWRCESFNSWIFSDECSVQRTSNIGQPWCFRFVSETYRRDLVNAKVHVKDISQMVWAGIWLGGRTPLVIMDRDEDSPSRRGYTAASYIQALEKGLLPFYQPSQVFQQDNARIHTAVLSKEWFETHGIWVED